MYVAYHRIPKGWGCSLHDSYEYELYGETFGDPCYWLVPGAYIDDGT